MIKYNRKRGRKDSNDLRGERWKLLELDIADYLAISNLGRLKNLKTNKILQPAREGHYYITLNNVSHFLYLPDLMQIAFHGNYTDDYYIRFFARRMLLVWKTNAIVQIDLNGRYIRKYIDVEDVIDAHPTWNAEELQRAIDNKDRYKNYKWLYMSEYQPNIY